jgi:hypothetical protein
MTPVETINYMINVQGMVSSSIAILISMITQRDIAEVKRVMDETFDIHANAHTLPSQGETRQ